MFTPNPDKNTDLNRQHRENRRFFKMASKAVRDGYNPPPELLARAAASAVDMLDDPTAGPRDKLAASGLLAALNRDHVKSLISMAKLEIKLEALALQNRTVDFVTNSDTDALDRARRLAEGLGLPFEADDDDGTDIQLID